VKHREHCLLVGHKGRFVIAGGKLLDARILSSMSRRRLSWRSECKGRIPGYFLPQPGLADRLGDDIDGATEDMSQLRIQLMESAERGESAFSKRGVNPDDEIEVRAGSGLASRD